jgi:hypothetical protein
MITPMWRGARLPVLVFALALAVSVMNGQSVFAHGGGGGGGGGGHGGGGGGHGGGGGGHGGGGHSGGHYGGGGHSGGYQRGGNNFNNGFFPIFYGGYGGYGYGYGYSYPYYNNGYSYPYNGYDYSQGFGATASSPAVYASPAQGRYLGIDEQPVTDASGSGMKVMQVYSGSAAQQAGLQVGDVIYSANGYTTQQPGNLAWIIATVPSNGVLQMTVRTARDGAFHVINAQLP